MKLSRTGPQVLDSDLWNSPIRICMWENGIRRFELNPNEHTLFINIREGQTASNIVRKLAVDIPTKYTIEKLALCRTIFHSKVDPKKLTSLVIHRLLLVLAQITCMFSYGMSSQVQSYFLFFLCEF